MSSPSPPPPGGLAYVHCRGATLVHQRLLGTFAFYDAHWATRTRYGLVWLDADTAALVSPAWNHTVRLVRDADGTYTITAWLATSASVFRDVILPPGTPTAQATVALTDFCTAWTHFSCAPRTSRARPASDQLPADLGNHTRLVAPVFVGAADVVRECVGPLCKLQTKRSALGTGGGLQQQKLTSSSPAFPGADAHAAGFVARSDSSTTLWLFRAAAVPALLAFAADGTPPRDLALLKDDTLFALDYLLHVPSPGQLETRLEVVRKRLPAFFADCASLRDKVPLVARVFDIGGGVSELMVTATVEAQLRQRVAHSNSVVDRVPWATVRALTRFDKATASDAALAAVAARLEGRVIAASFDRSARYLATRPHALYTLTTQKLRQRMAETRATARDLGVAAYLPGGEALRAAATAEFSERLYARVGHAFTGCIIHSAAGIPATPNASLTAVQVADAHLLSAEQMCAILDALERAWASLRVDVAQTQVEFVGCAALCTLRRDGTRCQFLPFRFLVAERLSDVRDFAVSPLAAVTDAWQALVREEARVAWAASAMAKDVHFLLLSDGHHAAPRSAHATLAVAELAHFATRPGRTVCMALEEFSYMALDEFYTLVCVLWANPGTRLLLLSKSGTVEDPPLERLQRGTCLQTHYPFPDEAVY